MRCLYSLYTLTVSQAQQTLYKAMDTIYKRTGYKSNLKAKNKINLHVVNNNINFGVIFFNFHTIIRSLEICKSLKKATKIYILMCFFIRMLFILLSLVNTYTRQRIINVN